MKSWLWNKRVHPAALMGMMTDSQQLCDQKSNLNLFCRDKLTKWLVDQILHSHVSIVITNEDRTTKITVRDQKW